MSKKNGLVVRRKIPAPKRWASTLPDAATAGTDQIMPPQKGFPIVDIGALAGGMESPRVIEEGHHVLQAILQSTSDGILAVNQDNEVLFANERFAEMWLIPQEIMASNDDHVLLQYVLDQLSDPQSFLQKVQELYHSAEESFDMLYFKDGRVFERRSRPMLQETGMRGRVWSFHEITERKRIEEALVASEAELRALFASMQDVVMVIDREEVCRKIAPTNPGLLYEPPEELLGRNLKDIFPAEEAGVFRGVVKQVLDTKQNAQIEYELIIGGRIVWCQTTISPLNADSTLWVAHDITKRKHMEEAVRIAEEDYRSIFENATVGIYQSTPQGFFLSVNPLMARIFGFDSPEDMLNSNIINSDKQGYVDPAGRHEFQRLVMEQGEVHEFISLNRRKDGGYFWIEESAHAVKDVYGNIIYYEGFLTDITERKLAEEALAKEQYEMQTLMNYLPTYIYFKDRASRFTRISKSQSLRFGLSDPAQAIGKTDSDFFAAEHARQAYEDEQAIIQTGQPLIKEEKETWADHPDTWVSTIKMPMRDNEGNIIGTYGISTDITERKQVEEELRRAKGDLETALLKLQQSLEREILLANTDGLTGLCNHRHFFELATREFQAAVRYQHPLAFVMFDLDYFKKINDTLGHTAGDKLLVEVAQIAVSKVRASDLVARYGGDEFIVLLPHANAQQALAVAERIRASVATMPVGAFRDDKEPFTVTLSIGIAEMRHEPADDNVERIVQRTDDALYKAKRSGRNRTVIFGQDEL
jgi:diguanylate cyclase (GGDEF)-like protein/PAS domain S-box-containing protein